MFIAGMRAFLYFTTGDILKSVWSHKTQLITKKKKILSNLFSCRHPNKEIEIDDKVTMLPRCEIDDRLSTLPLPRVPGTRLQGVLFLNKMRQNEFLLFYLNPFISFHEMHFNLR